MNLRGLRSLLPFAFLSASLFTTNIVVAQEHQDYLERLRNPARVRGFIGGESHDSYVIRARRGQRMTVRLSWRPDDSLGIGDNHAEFYVSSLPTFSGEGAVKFGKESKNGRRWSGVIPRTADYYIYVVAHPTAHYTLRVSVK